MTARCPSADVASMALPCRIGIIYSATHHCHTETLEKHQKSAPRESASPDLYI